MLTTRSQTFPLPSRQSIEIDFLENRNIDLGIVGIERKCTFDTERQKFVPQVAIRETAFDAPSEPANPFELQRTQDSLKAAIEKLREAKGKKCTKIANFHLSDAHSWSDVVKVVLQAEQDYLKDDCLSGKVRKAFRRIGDNAKSIKPFVNLLPEGNYKTLCGGLTLVLTAMMKKAEYRDKMADILNELPLTIQECEDYAQIYPGKNTMRLRIEELYIQLVGAIEDMIRWYTQKSLSRVTKSLLKTDAYADAIDNRIKAIKGSQDAFDKETRKYLHWRTELIDRTTVETHMVVQVINEDVVRIGQKVWESSHRIEDIESAVKSQTEVFNGVTDVLRDVCKKAEWLQDRKTYQQKVVDQNTRIQELEMQLQKKTFRVKTLAKRLNLAMPDDCYWPDLDVALAAGATCSLRYQGQARHIAEAEEFQGWFQSRESAVLCINGNFEQHSLSPTAYLGALLIQNSDIDNVLVLRFFCGLHTSPTTAGDHELEGPFLLIRSLLAQALGAGGIDEKQRLSFLNEDDAQAMEDASFSHYLGTFIKLVKGLLQDYHGIIVIIDGIEYYDYEGRKKLKKVIKALLKTTGKSSLVGYLKVLIMASSYSKVFGDVDDVQILDMPNDIERIGSGFDSLAELN